LRAAFRTLGIAAVAGAVFGGEVEEVVAGALGQVRDNQPAHGGPRQGRVAVTAAAQDPVRFGDIPAPVKVNALQDQTGCLALR
jgi:hypothetical protein